VWPRPPWSPVIRLARDYFADYVDGEEGRLLAAAIELEFSDRFAQDVMDHDFADLYTFRILEAFVLLRTITPEQRTNDELVAQIVAELRTLLAKPHYQLRSAVLLLDVGLIGSMDPISFSTATLIPVQLLSGMERVVYGLFPTLRGTDIRRSYPMWSEDHAALLVVENRAAKYEEAQELNARDVQRVVDACRLATGGTFESAFLAEGQPGHLTAWPSVFELSPGRVFRWTRRVVRIDQPVAESIEAMARVLDELRAGARTVTPFDVALYRYSRSFQTAAWQEQLLDLAIALESMLGGGDDKEDIGLRLRTRAGWLLGSDNHSAADLYNDIKVFYDLRSKIVHGVAADEKYLRKTFARLSVHKNERGTGISAQVAIDRMRDIVRRAILARASLALPSGVSAPPLWPIGSSMDPAAILINDNLRKHWQSSWRARFQAIGFDPDYPIAKLEIFAETGSRPLEQGPPSVG
jgi:Apea-like HEPN